MRRFRSVVVFPVFGLALLLPKLQILWWSLGRGVALINDPLPHFDAQLDPHDSLEHVGDSHDEYTRLG